MTRELGHTLSTLVHARRQVWLAQSPLTEPCRRTLRALPVVPGERFGSAALEALERTAQASRTRQQLAGLHRPPRRPIAAGGSFRGSFPPPVPFLGSTSMAPRPRPARAQGDHGGAQGLRPVRSAHSSWRFPRPSGGPPVMFWSRRSGFFPRASSVIRLFTSRTRGCCPLCPGDTVFSSAAGLLSPAEPR
ncbi:hypothetical protein ILYODFUR_033306 [Ilyodon furcidens]|uniref:Uncharacterized protein n=1 Tax=Ilyodon furcidens TaxID=33524 RepID=A0ABV0TEF3_9TELE